MLYATALQFNLSWTEPLEHNNTMFTLFVIFNHTLLSVPLDQTDLEAKSRLYSLL